MTEILAAPPELSEEQEGVDDGDAEAEAAEEEGDGMEET
jgi:hypothetical protein